MFTSAVQFKLPTWLGITSLLTLCFTDLAKNLSNSNTTTKQEVNKQRKAKSKKRTKKTKEQEETKGSIVGWEFCDKMGKTPLSTSLLAGATAGVAASLVLQPLDYAKTQQQALVRAQGLQSPPTLRQTMISTIRSDGIRALWSGLGPSVARASIGPGLYFGLLNQMTTSKLAVQLSESNRMAVSFFCSATSRALAGVLLNPVSVVKVSSATILKSLLKLSSHLLCA